MADSRISHSPADYEAKNGLTQLPAGVQEFTEQEILNLSFDKEFGLLSTAMLGFNPDTGEYQALKFNSAGALETSASFSGSFTGAAAFSDASNVDSTGLVDNDRHVQVDVLTMPSISVDPPVGGATEAKQDDAITLLTTIEANQLPDSHNVTVDNASIAVTGTFWQATQPVSGTVTAVDSQPSSATLTSVLGTTSSTQLLSSNVNRKMVTFYNDSIADLYLKWGATASTSSFTIKMAANSYYELPRPVYTGRIDGIWSAASGAVRITEV